MKREMYCEDIPVPSLSSFQCEVMIVTKSAAKVQLV